ncbi:MAG: hypothetical protein WBZ29_04585 [Methanocella sp.]
MSIREMILISVLCAGMMCAVFFLCITAPVVRAQNMSSSIDDTLSPLGDDVNEQLITDPAFQPYLEAEPVNMGIPSLPAFWIFFMGMVAMIAIPVFWLVFKQKNNP